MLVSNALSPPHVERGQCAVSDPIARSQNTEFILLASSALSLWRLLLSSPGEDWRRELWPLASVQRGLAGREAARYQVLGSGLAPPLSSQGHLRQLLEGHLIFLFCRGGYLRLANVGKSVLICAAKADFTQRSVGPSPRPQIPKWRLALGPHRVSGQLSIGRVKEVVPWGNWIQLLIFQMRNLKFREGKWRAQGHAGRAIAKSRSWGPSTLHLGSSIAGYTLLVGYACIRPRR